MPKLVPRDREHRYRRARESRCLSYGWDGSARVALAIAEESGRHVRSVANVQVGARGYVGHSCVDDPSKCRGQAGRERPGVGLGRCFRYTKCQSLRGVCYMISCDNSLT